MGKKIVARVLNLGFKNRHVDVFVSNGTHSHPTHETPLCTTAAFMSCIFPDAITIAQPTVSAFVLRSGKRRGAGRRRVWEGNIRALCRRFCSSLPARAASLSPASTPIHAVCGSQQPPLQHLPEKLCSKFICLSRSLKVSGLLLVLDCASLLVKKIIIKKRTTSPRIASTHQQNCVGKWRSSHVKLSKPFCFCRIASQLPATGKSLLPLHFCCCLCPQLQPVAAGVS